MTCGFETFNEKHVLGLLARAPEAELIAHPECAPSLLRHAHFIGSTKRLLDYTATSATSTFIVATESGILHTMRLASPHKTFIAAAPDRGADPTCGCSTCPYMKLNTLEKVQRCLQELAPEVTVDEEIRRGALQAIERMVAIG